MNYRWLTTIAGGLLLALLVVVGTAAVAIVNEDKPTVVTAAPSQALHSRALPNAGAVTINGAYSGEVAVKWVLGGLYSEPLPTPTPQAPGTPVALDLGTVDLAFQLSQSGTAISGYVDSAQTLIVSVEHTLADGTKTGPTVTGSFDGTTLTLTSERFSTLLDGQTIERQFRLIGQVDGANENLIVGEYRETFWGLTDEPCTAIGPFRLQRFVVRATAIDPSNSVPNTGTDTVTTNRGVAVTINVLTNDSDANGDTLTVTAVSQPQFGTATTNGQTVSYTPQATFVGVDSFTYFVSDGKGDAVAGSVTVTVNGPGGPNRAPNVSNDIVTTAPGIAVTIDVLGNDSDPDGDPLTITIETQPRNGVATVVNGKIVYTPNAGFTGTDTIRYSVSDGKGGTATATVTVNVGGQPGSSTLYLPLIQR